jgi:hypothetical protein
MKKLFIFILFITVLCSCKKCENAEPACENGFEFVDNNCQCPTGKFVVQNQCRGLLENEYWAVMPDKYPCRDTILFGFGVIDTNSNKVQARLVILDGEPVTPAVPTIWADIPLYKNNQGVFFETFGHPYCIYNGFATNIRWVGKFAKDFSEFDAKMYIYSVGNPLIDLDSMEVKFIR